MRLGSATRASLRASLSPIRPRPRDHPRRPLLFARRSYPRSIEASTALGSAERLAHRRCAGAGRFLRRAAESPRSAGCHASHDEARPPPGRPPK